MRRHLRQLAKPARVALVLLVLAVAAVFVAAGGSNAVQAETAILPPVPHPLEAASQVPAPAAPSPTPTPSAWPATPSTATQTAPTTSLATSDTACISCHQAPIVVTLASNETITATVNVKDFADSVHGNKLTCVACHPDKAGGYPHPKVTAADRRAYTVAAAEQCVTCHKSVGGTFDNSVHGKALAAGNTQAATCVDCHGAHTVGDPTRIDRKPQVCAPCHAVVVETYDASVHGQLVASGRSDAATCLACHTSDRSGHSIVAVDDPNGPTSPTKVSETCGKCHTQALKSYNSTFHGRAMRLGVAHNAANCVDCHGAYGVQRVHAAERPVNENKLATVCAKCHPGATESFASGWMGHEEASPSWFPAVFLTERFLFFLTTSAVAFGILHVELDLLRWLVRRRKDGDKKKEGK